MVVYPEVCKRAQEEIDQVIGHGRLPDAGDRERLVYLDSVIHETMRYYNLSTSTSSSSHLWLVCFRFSL